MCIPREPVGGGRHGRELIRNELDVKCIATDDKIILYYSNCNIRQLTYDERGDRVYAQSSGRPSRAESSTHAPPQPSMPHALQDRWGESHGALGPTAHHRPTAPPDRGHDDHHLPRSRGPERRHALPPSMTRACARICLTIRPPRPWWPCSERASSWSWCRGIRVNIRTPPRSPSASPRPLTSSVCSSLRRRCPSA
jgi:hypothetical protein